eukprot:TRINITY_DN2635_c0_g1_i1.p1 TRINITY_DN2635_c0_g1~~TRINITY_DN2635_c0_g1_i1.p1  ORF type:complete len:251 (-),score=80.52 TRINITY_DN2635_c0_g1_i1:4-720(-)
MFRSLMRAIPTTTTTTLSPFRLCGGGVGGVVARAHGMRWMSAHARNELGWMKRNDNNSDYHATTVLCVRKGDKVVMVSDGQVTRGSEVVKGNARKVRELKSGIIAGFAGATADAFTLFERLEMQLDEHPGQLLRACVELAKQWRTEKYLRHLEAVMIVADKDISLTITGNGDVVEPEDGIIGIGSGGGYALACARGLIDTDLTANEICEKSMTVAGDLCIYTNKNWCTMSLDLDVKKE